MIISKENILEYIPHRPPFLMVDSLSRITPEQFESEFFIMEDNMLVEDGFFQASGLIENIAQTCAAGFGILEQPGDGVPKMGFIGAISKLEVFELPPVNSVITTTVVPTHQLGNIFLVKGLNSLEGRKLLECEMKIVVN
jgi:predicted hotdog family 3-hydroxylacyl-ACP dehydratase